MRSTTHAQKPDRLALPRRLVPRRPNKTVKGFLDAIKVVPIARFCVGDMIHFKCADGWRHVVTILGILPGGVVDAMVYDGRPHYVGITIADLMPLRVTHLETMGPNDVGMYRRLLKLDPEGAV